MPEDRRTASPIATRSRVPWWLLAVLLLVSLGLAGLRAAPAQARDVLLPALSSYGEAATRRGAKLGRLLERLQDAPVAVKLREVNAFFNAFSWRADQDLWRAADHWSTPVEFIGQGAGDCEDFAIGKYFALRWAGVPADALRVVYVRDLRTGRSHMVLEYRPPGGSPAVVLDNLRRAPLPRHQRPELVFIYAFNEHRLAVSVPGGAEVQAAHGERWNLVRWDHLIARAGGENTRAGHATGLRLALLTTP